MIRNKKGMISVLMLFFMILGSVCYGSALDDDFYIQIKQFSMQIGWGLDCPIQKAAEVSFYFEVLQFFEENYSFFAKEKCSIFIYLSFKNNTYFLDYYYDDNLKKVYSANDEDEFKPVLLDILRDLVPLGTSKSSRDLTLFMISETSNNDASIPSEIIVNSFVNQVNSQGYLFSYFFRLEDAVQSISKSENNGVVIINRKSLKKDEINDRFFLTEFR